MDWTGIKLDWQWAANWKVAFLPPPWESCLLFPPLCFHGFYLVLLFSPCQAKLQLTCFSISEMLLLCSRGSRRCHGPVTWAISDLFVSWYASYTAWELIFLHPAKIFSYMLFLSEEYPQERNPDHFSVWSRCWNILVLSSNLNSFYCCLCHFLQRRKRNFGPCPLHKE